MSLAGGKTEAHGSSVGVNNSVNLVGQSTSRRAQAMLSVPLYPGPMLLREDGRCADHLYRRIMSGGQRLHDPANCPTGVREGLAVMGTREWARRSNELGSQT